MRRVLIPLSALIMLVPAVAAEDPPGGGAGGVVLELPLIDDFEAPGDGWCHEISVIRMCYNAGGPWNHDALCIYVNQWDTCLVWWWFHENVPVGDWELIEQVSMCLLDAIASHYWSDWDGDPESFVEEPTPNFIDCTRGIIRP